MNWDIMGAWFLFNVMVCVAAVSFAIFLNTKAGKKWKKNLQEMEAYLFFNVMMFVFALSFAIFLNTKAGTKWKDNL